MAKIKNPVMGFSICVKWYSEKESNLHHDHIRVLSGINRLH